MPRARRCKQREAGAHRSRENGMSKVSRREALKLAGGAGLFVGGLASAGGASAQAGKVAITFLLVNDFYGFSEKNGRGGFARLAGVVAAERARASHVVFCHAGDTFSPSLMSGFDQGAHIVEMTNMLAPDVFVPGNHEFDFGKEVYLRRVSESKFPYFAANLRAPDGAVLPGHRDRAIIEKGGVKLGFTGIALEKTPQVSSSGDLAFAPELETLGVQARALRAEGADIVIAVTHTAMETDFAIQRSRVVDVLLTGHDHDLRVVYDGRVAMVESGEDAQYVTAVDLVAEVSERDGRRSVSWRPNFRIIDTATVTPDAAMLAVVKRYEAELSKELDVTIGTTATAMDSRSAVVRGGEAAIGNLIADAIRASTGADVAITNGGGIRAGKQYAAGSALTRRDILSELPFGNATVMVEITGADLLAALENGLSDLENRGGRFPHVSGMKVVADSRAPKGARVVSVEVGGRPLDPLARYKVASNDFMLRGGDGYGALGRGRALVGVTDGKLMANEVMVFVRRAGTVSPVVEGRIVIR
jgi:2',3'-cyclic-nucleotide 2'-phosphodiesterase (5'-nucleotidase family)